MPQAHRAAPPPSFGAPPPSSGGHFAFGSASPCSGAPGAAPPPSFAARGGRQGGPAPMMGGNAAASSFGGFGKYDRVLDDVDQILTVYINKYLFENIC